MMHAARWSRWIVLSALVGAAGVAHGQGAIAVLELDRGKNAPRKITQISLAVDADDDDEDGVVDAEQTHVVPLEDARGFVVEGERAPVRVNVTGALRVLRRGEPVALPLTLSPRDLPATLHLQATRASRAEGDAMLLLESGNTNERIPVTAFGIALLDARNGLLDARRDALSVSRRITNDATLPRRSDYAGTSGDPENIRVEIFDPTVRGNEVRATLERVDPRSGAAVDSLGLVLRRPSSNVPFRSQWVRLVADEIDHQAPSVEHQVLGVGLRDAVRVQYATPHGTATQSLRVGRPGDDDGPLAARRARLRIRILRMHPGGPAVIGTDDSSALQVARHQVAIANEIWVQCFIDFGTPESADVALVDPPPPSLVAVGDEDGLPAAGGGTVRLRIDDRVIRPVTTRHGAPPVATALDIAAAIRAAGFQARVTENAPAEFGAGRSADVLVRTRAGGLVTIDRDEKAPFSTDAQQSVRVGVVDLSDGIAEFDNMTAASGTLEERSLIKSLSDDLPSTIDLFIVNRFTSGTRQGEAFIEGDGGAIINTLLLDRNGLRQQREAWTQAHEVGHILLNQPYHPDNVGPDRPWLLMDADNSLGMVTGPKRLTLDECHRVATESGVDAVPALLSRTDARRARPPANPQHFDIGYPRP